jgi:hypothetical protein
MPYKDPEKRKARQKAYREVNKEIDSERRKAWREANAEKLKAYFKARYEANKERLLAAQKAYREANLERIRERERTRTHREANKAHKQTYDKAYRDANSARVKANKKAHYTANADRYIALSARRRSSERHATPPWVNLEELYGIWMSCPECFHVDHIHPLKGKYASGLNVPWNLQYLPAAENISKHNRPPPPGYLDWWADQSCIHAESTGRVWSPTNPEDE